jgi:type VI secretion system secreted protein VgrG
MRATLIDDLSAALVQFRSAKRLYGISIGGGGHGADSLLVEAFVADDVVHGIGVRDVIVLATNAHIKAQSLLGQPAALQISLADRSRAAFAGNISAVASLGSDGGFARYRLRITPWLLQLGQVRNSRAWQDKTVIDIVDDVFSAYSPLARWRWSDETGPFMECAVARSFCCQYRESDLAFVERLLTEEGLAWRFEQTDDGPGLVVFADSKQLCAVPHDPSSKSDGGIRFHSARAGERQDTVQALSAHRSIHASLTTLLSSNYKGKRSVTASSPSSARFGKLPPLESYDTPGQYAFADTAQAMRYADIQMEGREARSQPWRGRSTVRTLRAGTRMRIVDVPRKEVADKPDFTVLRVISVGVNNLPAPAQHALAELFGPIPELLQESMPVLVQDFMRRDALEDFALVVAQARLSGYANYFEAIPADVTWRPQLADSDGRNHPRPTAHGSQSAIVVGADGSSQANGADEIHCDRLGRVRIRFHWQDRNAAGCWVRVAQRAAGGGMGSQFLPRIGMEVMVQFMEGDIDRPIIVGAMYNGQGEGGLAPTTGGKAATEAASSPFAPANDQRVSGQGNIASGNSPVWHGASADLAGHSNASALWGIRSKEFGGAGYNQLVFDDTDDQGRVQLKTSHAGTELNLGHLVHNTDNYRGSFRGTGAELRTDAYGSVRAGAGLLITSYIITHGARARDPAGDNAAGIALLKQAKTLAETFSQAATTHQTVAMAAHAGATKANASKLDEQSAPLKAMLTAVSGIVSAAGLGEARHGAGRKNIAQDDQKVPHATDPIVAVAAKAGLGVTAAQSVQLASGEIVTVMSGQDTQFVAGGQLRMHTGQAIGVLGGAMQAGENNLGVQIIAAQGVVELQAQADVLNVKARDLVEVISANAHIDWAAAKSISLSTAGGANITISNGNITVQCPGKITVHAGMKSFLGPARISYDMPLMPAGNFALRSKYPFSL